MLGLRHGVLDGARQLVKILNGPRGEVGENGRANGDSRDLPSGVLKVESYAKAVRTARWLLENRIQQVDNPSNGSVLLLLQTLLGDDNNPMKTKKWAAQLLESLLCALTPEGSDLDLTEQFALLDRILGMPGLIRGLADYAQAVHVQEATATPPVDGLVMVSEEEWELVPITLLWQCGQRAQENDDWRQHMALATNEMLDMLTVVLSERPSGAGESLERDFDHRRYEKWLAMYTVADLSWASSPCVRRRLAEHSELVKSLIKLSLLEFDDDDDAEWYEIRAMAACVLERLHQLSPDMPVMLDALWKELLPGTRAASRLTKLVSSLEDEARCDSLVEALRTGSLSASSLSAHLLLVRTLSAYMDSSLPSLVAYPDRTSSYIPPLVDGYLPRLPWEVNQDS